MCFSCRFYTVQTRGFRPSTWLSCPGLSKAGVAVRAQSFGSCTIKPNAVKCLFKIKKVYFNTRILHYNTVPKLPHTSLSILCCFIENRAEGMTRNGGGKRAKAWNKKSWLSYCVVAPSNSTSNRTENKL